jgi:excinuclease ABC subunit B
MYGDKITKSMKATIDKTNARRKLQTEYNQKHHITPAGITRAIDETMRTNLKINKNKPKFDLKKIPKDEYGHLIKDLTIQMELASANLQFEQAAEFRDMINDLKSKI